MSTCVSDRRPTWPLRRRSATCCKWCTRTLSVGRTRFRHTRVWAGWGRNCSLLRLACSARREHLSRCMSARSTATGLWLQSQPPQMMVIMSALPTLSELVCCTAGGEGWKPGICAPLNIACSSCLSRLFPVRYIFALNMFELGYINSTEWAVYQDWHSFLVQQFGQRVELEGIIYLRAPPKVWTPEILFYIQEIQLISWWSRKNMCLLHIILVCHYCNITVTCHWHYLLFFITGFYYYFLYFIGKTFVPSQICMQRLEHRGRAEEKGVKLDYLDKLHVQHERWLVEKSTEWVLMTSCLCCLCFMFWIFLEANENKQFQFGTGGC